MPRFPKEIEYSDKYRDDFYEYRHVLLSKNAYERLKRIDGKRRILSEDEWRYVGIQQSRGWQHFLNGGAEPNILVFRRPIGTNPNTGEAPLGSEERRAAYLEERKRFLAEQSPEMESFEISDRPIFRTKL